MNDKIEKLLTPPHDWQWGEFFNQEGQKFRYGWNCPKDAKALIIILEGRTETAEEYFENIRDLNAQGYACAIMDWQGQGLSYRYGDDNTRHHSEGFEKNIEDFHSFMKELIEIKLYQSLPKIMLAHSMGGMIGLHILAGEYGNKFEKACLVAPMLGLKPKILINIVANSSLKIIERLNRIDRHAFGQKKWNELYANIAKYKVSSDPVRREVQPCLFRTRPELQCGGVTFGWVSEALKSMKQLQNHGYCSHIQIPVFMALAGADAVVDNKEAKKVAACLPDCVLKTYAKAQHQPHREKDTIREEFFNDFHAFIEG